MPHRADGLGLNADQPAALDRVATGDSLPLAQLDVAESWTVPPEPLREAELIEAMPTNPNPNPIPSLHEVLAGLEEVRAALLHAQRRAERLGDVLRLS